MVLIFIIVVLIVALSAVAVMMVNKKPELKTIFQIVYAVIIVVLGFMLYRTIMEPIEFKRERAKREDATILVLKDIRTVQQSYKDKYDKFTGSFDTLITFIQTDSFELEKIVQRQDWNQDETSKEDALKQGILERSVFKVNVRDSLFGADFDVENLRYIPFTPQKEFELAAGEVETGSQVRVKVFEAYALYDDLFAGLDRQEVINYKDARYKITSFDGVKVGSLTEANNNAGNWEK